MATVNVWPRLGTTVTLESGYVITAAGAQAETTKEIVDLIRERKLLTFDPTQENPNPSPIPPSGGGSGGGLLATTLTQLGLTSGTATGELCNLLGGLATNDGCQGTFAWDAGSSATIVPGMCVAASGGRWNRLYSGPVNVRWFGAVGDGIADDTSAIQAAVDYASDVYVPVGTYKITDPIDLNDNQLLRGEGKDSILSSTGTYAIRMLDTKLGEVRDLHIVCVGSGRSGIRIEATGAGNPGGEVGYVLQPSITRVQIDLPSSGTCVGIDCYTGGTAPGQYVVYFPLIVEPFIQLTAGRNATSSGIKMRAQAGIAASVGGRVLNGRISVVCRAVDLDHCDTWEINGTSFDGCSSLPGATDPSGDGRGVYFGSVANQCAATACRFEDCDVYYESQAVGSILNTTYGFPAGKLINSGGGQVFVNGDGEVKSTNTQNTQFTRRVQAARSFELGFYEAKNVTSGTYQSLADNSGVTSPIIRVVDAVGAFAVGSIKLDQFGEMLPSGSLKYVYNTTSQDMTIKHQDAGGLEAERIVTMTGADVVVPGPAVARFYYDLSVTGSYGAGRWVYMGAG